MICSWLPKLCHSAKQLELVFPWWLENGSCNIYGPVYLILLWWHIPRIDLRMMLVTTWASVLLPVPPGSRSLTYWPLCSWRWDLLWKRGLPEATPEQPSGPPPTLASGNGVRVPEGKSTLDPYPSAASIQGLGSKHVYIYIYIDRSTSQEKEARVRHMSQEKGKHESGKNKARVRKKQGTSQEKARHESGKSCTSQEKAKHESGKRRHESGKSKARVRKKKSLS